MTKLKLGVAAGIAAILAFGVAACGQTTTTTEPAPVEEVAPAPVEPVAPPAEAPVDGAAPAAEAPAATTP